MGGAPTFERYSSMTSKPNLAYNGTLRSFEDSR
jgi:hypothetical protein